jgi:hypothetical protein
MARRALSPWTCFECRIPVNRSVTDIAAQCFYGAPGIRRGQDTWIDYCCEIQKKRTHARTHARTVRDTSGIIKHVNMQR